MPGWSSEIANEFLARSFARQEPLDQLQVQDLVYIAHGWCLALHDEPLTGDRPVARAFGPQYSRLAEALASYGARPILRLITCREVYPGLVGIDPDEVALAKLCDFELELIETVFRFYGDFPASRLGNITRVSGAPWEQVFAEGAGVPREIPHALIKAQFSDFVAEAARADASHAL